jgi:predicted DNA repair protein MutK
MKGLSVAGTAAMFLVGGGILAHGIPPLHHWTQELEKGGGLAGTLGPMLVSAVVGLAAGGVIVGVVTLAGKLKARSKATA